MTKVAVLLTFVVLLATPGCTGGDTPAPTPAVPPAKAYPRLALPTADSLATVGDGTVGLAVNPAASVIAGPAGDGASMALTVTYPGLGVKIYYTVRRLDRSEQEAAVENRLERISLNLNGVPARTDFTSPDCSAEGFIVTTVSASLTPVQLLVSGDGYIVTGTAFIENPATAEAYDSIRPLIEMIYDDMSRAVPSVRYVRE